VRECHAVVAPCSFGGQALIYRGGGAPVPPTLRALADARKWEEAVSTLRSARAEGVRCDRGSYTQAIRAAGESGQTDEAMSLYALALEDGVFSHWRSDEPFTLDLDRFAAQTAACAVRHALYHEVGNFLESDLRITTGPRCTLVVEKLLSEELQPPLPFRHEMHTTCDERDCMQVVDDSSLVVPLQTLFTWLTSTKPYDAFVIRIPPADADAPLPPAPPPARVPEAVRRAFARFDRNESGGLDPAELKNALSQLGMGASDAETIAVLRRYDADGNRRISLHEFSRLVRELGVVASTVREEPEDRAPSGDC